MDPNSPQYWNCRAFSSLHSNLQLSLSAALKGAYNMPLLELVYNPRQFGENQLVSITAWFSWYSAPVCILWKLTNFGCIFFLLFLLPWSKDVCKSCACVKMFVYCAINLIPLMAKTWNVCDLTVLNINLLLWFNHSFHFLLLFLKILKITNSPSYPRKSIRYRKGIKVFQN